MTREIKVRGWRRKYQEWVTGYLIIREDPHLHDIVSPVGESSSVTSSVERDSIGQFTGLKDENGIEIYEGDIIKRGDLPDEEPNFIVRFGRFTESPDYYHELDNYGWYVESIVKRDKYNNSLLHVLKTLDVIVCGNIYEHPEMLEATE